MAQLSTRTVLFKMQPLLLSKHLGSDLYPSPADALGQLVANSLDAGCSCVNITIDYNQLGAPELVTISDDGCGMSPEVVDNAFSLVGRHVSQTKTEREVIGSRGIGRFAVFALAAESHWVTVAEVDGSRIRQSWEMIKGLEIEVGKEVAPDAETGTTIKLVPKQDGDVVRALSSPSRVKRDLFNAFASYLLRYQNEVKLRVNGEEIDPNDFVEQNDVEEIEETENVPRAQLRHLLLGQSVEQHYPCMLQFATHGATIISQAIEGESITGRKYLGLVDSPYLSELTNTAKSELAVFDERFRALEAESTSRAKQYIARIQGDRTVTFLEHVRSQAFYPYKNPPRTVVDAVSRDAFETVLVAMEEEIGISSLPAKQMRLVCLLAQQLLHNEDLATILTSVLDLKGEHVTKFADLLRSTTLNSIIAAAELVVSRFRCLDELRELVYGCSAVHVKERRHLHKIIERHTWLFGEQYNLMGSDTSIDNLLQMIHAAVKDVEDDEARIDVRQELRDIPDLYLMTTKWNEGSKYHQHLIVELKRPSTCIVPKHIEQLERYAEQIVNSPMFSQRQDSHRFTFVAVSSAVSQRVKRNRYQRGREPGFISEPNGYDHPTELWALQWSDYFDRRAEELRFLKEKIEITADPLALQYLRRTSGGFLPPDMPSTDTV